MQCGLVFREEHAKFPVGRVTSTCLRGDEGFKRIEVGDVVGIEAMEGANNDLRYVGRAAVTAKKLTTKLFVLRDAHENHFCQAVGGMPKRLLEDDREWAERTLEDVITSLHGELPQDEVFTVLYLLPLNEKH